MPIVVTTSSNDTPKEAVTPEAQTEETIVDETESASEEQSDETAEESDTSEQEESEESPKEEKPKKKNGFKKRIDKLTTKLSAKEAEIEYWKQQALKKGQSDEPKSPKEVVREGKPKAEDFESHDDYVEALTEWKLDQKIKSLESKQRETQVKTEHEKRLDQHKTRVSKFIESHEDFQDVIEDVDDIPMSIAVQEAILSSENGPELMYELAKNRDEYARICKLSPLEAARSIGRFEARLQKSHDVETREVKKPKPAPLKPVGSTASGSGRKSIYDPDLDFKEYERMRTEQLRRRRG